MSLSRVLITRPQPEAGMLAVSLERHSVSCLVMPAFSFEPTYPGLDFNDPWGGAGRRLAVFCSPRAVTFGLRQLPAGFFESVEVAAIGPATARDLEAAGINPSIMPGPPYTSETLLSRPELQGGPGRALLFTAPGGREALWEGLEARGWEPRWAYVYRSVPVAPDSEMQMQIAATGRVMSIWTSANALNHMSVSMQADAWQRICEGDFVVTSTRLAGHAAEFCRGEILLAGGPGNADIEATVLQALAQ